MKYIIYVIEERCKGADGCGLCIHVCPKKVLDRVDRLTIHGVRPPEPVRIDDCIGCDMCMTYCPDLAIIVEKTETAPKEESVHNK